MTGRLDTTEADKELARRFAELVGLHFQGAPVLDEWIGLWAEDGVYEQAFPASGKPVRCVGTGPIRAFVGPMGTVFRDFAFTDLEVHATDEPGLVLASARSTGTVVSTGRPYEQQYLWLFRISDGKVRHWLAYLNPLEVHKAFAG